MKVYEDWAIFEQASQRLERELQFFSALEVAACLKYFSLNFLSHSLPES